MVRSLKRKMKIYELLALVPLILMRDQLWLIEEEVLIIDGCTDVEAFEEMLRI